MGYRNKVPVSDYVIIGVIFVFYVALSLFMAGFVGFVMWEYMDWIGFPSFCNSCCGSICFIFFMMIFLLIYVAKHPKLG